MNYLTHEKSLQRLSETYKAELFRVMDFWTTMAIDHEFGGYFCALDRSGNVIDTDKGVWQTGRFAWMLAHLYNNFEKRDEWLQLSKHGIDFLEKHAYDEKGKLFFHLTREGKPVRMRRYAFSESFAAIAFAEYAKATGNESYAKKAIHAFENFIAYNTGKFSVEPKFVESTRAMKSIGFPMIGIVTAQVLRDTIHYENANEIITKFINEIERDFVNPEFQAVMENVGKNGDFVDHFDGRILNPGHAIEGAWFIMEEGRLQSDPSLIRLGAKMLDWMWLIGWDKTWGGILYFRDVRGWPVTEYWQDMKFWWPQCETIIATLLAYQLTGDEKFAVMHKEIHDWTFERFPDSEKGEWYGYLHRDGRISVDLKGNLWKGPFHIPRMLMKSWQISNELLATDTQRTKSK
ncbi:MAG: AGE family epimerase/isomerase [Candidatus Marinimicrobia bacterium]|nr:AGE family epimerase/isomerase [Candidatus Neomarinimicrobiota bacterium]